MAERIVCLKDSIFALGSTISSHLKDPTAANRQDLKALVAELRLLGGSLYSLEQLISELRAANDGKTDAPGFADEVAWPAVDGCELLVQALGALYAVADMKGLQAAKAALLGYRSKFGFIIGSSESLEDVDLHFCILGKEAMPQLRHRDEGTSDTQVVSRVVPAAAEEETTSEVLSSWLEALNSPDNDREPTQYVKETTLVQSRHLASPLYQPAAVRWPSYAESHWTHLKPQILSLFQVPGPFNFVQWVLEYARETFPRTYGSLAMSPNSLLELTDALCSNSIAPLHVAAALGLPSLCKELLLRGANVNEIGVLGSPLFCALVGPNVLTTRAEPESWAALLDRNHVGIDQAATVVLLLERGADCGYKYQWKNAEEVSLIGLSFWTAFITEVDAIFNHVVAKGVFIDGTIIHLIRRDNFANLGPTSRVRFIRMLAFLYDLTLPHEAERNAVTEPIREAVRLRMRDLGLAFADAGDAQCALEVKDPRFRYLVRQAIVNSNSFLFQRLLLDPRFDPNLLFDEAGLGGTILHMATEGGHVEIIDGLIKAGASLTATDSEGRTPMMVVEDQAVLSKMVLEHGASTTAVDKKGRTIWHLAASTNSVDLINWLRSNDPAKEQNLITRNKVGCTPLDDAFFFLNSLNALPKSWKPTAPGAARALLSELRTLPPISSPNALLFTAIQWGDLGLLDKLIELGCQPTVDRSGLLRCLNLSASDEMVLRVLELCEESSLVFSDGVTVAETIITNTVLRRRQNKAVFFQPTAHPSCFPKISSSVYKKLLTPEVLQARDACGRGIWARFCDEILPLLSGPDSEHPQKLSFLSNFICNAISCLNSCGALDDYEKETGEWAILYMADRASFSPCWHRWQFPFITAALQLFSRDELKFLDTTDGCVLLAQAARRGHLGLIDVLVTKGLRVHIPHEDFENKTVLERIIPNTHLSDGMLDALLDNLPEKALVPRQRKVFGAILDMDRKFQSAQLLTALLKKRLIDPNKVLADDQERGTMLLEAIERERPKLALTLLAFGADPALTVNGDYVLLAAAKKGYVEIFEKILEKAGSFDWRCFYNVPGKRTLNALQVAAMNGQHEALQWLLERTPLRHKLDAGSPRYGLAPIHLAVSNGSLACVKVLHECGADLEVRDPVGATPLIMAIRGDKEDIFRYLLESGVSTELDRYGIHIASVSRRAAAGIIDEFVNDKLGATPLIPFEVPDPIRMGALLADLIENSLLQCEGVIAKVLAYVPKEHLQSAILPCRGCTLLSFAGMYASTNIMLELVELGFGGFITGCETHWYDGYNALHHACFGLLRQLEYEESEESTLIFIRKCLDAYLKEGLLWFHVDCTPLHAVVQFGRSELSMLDIRRRILRVLLNHLDARAEDYWKLVEEAGLSQLVDLVDGDDTAARLKRYVVNRRCSSMDWLTYSSGVLPNALHLLVDSVDPAVEMPVDVLCDMVHQLIESGVDVNAKDGDSMTALQLACFRENLPIVKMLLEAGADPNARDYSDSTPLSRAIDWGEMEAVRYLIQHGADPTTFHGLSHLLFSHPSPEYLHEVATLGLDWHATTPGNSSLALMMIVVTPSTRMSVLNGIGDIDFARLASEQPPLLNMLISHQCGTGVVSKGDVSMLDTLLKFGWDFENEGSDEGSPLMLACSVGQLITVKLLVRRGARLAYVTTDSHGRKVVKSAFEMARLHKDVMQWLLVGRHQEWKCLEEADDVSPNVATKLWSGPRKGAHKLSGFDGHFIKASGNTIHEQLKLLHRVAQIRSQLANQVVPVTLVELLNRGVEEEDIDD
ncbi:ankyrin repeat-containing domain protein [Dactylonectria estremocensis]|uniref:Ankyrin repeat-containing domain protein n=1 Tax=Dactylonectria estremocensis TaxID=1079267 RepID=A0A9P9JI19_9HYPO|nr:ankyrin repeat-containing domain protein [Dactylonectria estremocensis]